MRLDVLQRAMMQAIDGGPEFVQAGAFLGSSGSVLRGFAVHANTISHARLVALEESFPRTRHLLGAEKFNRLSRSFTGRSECCVEPLATIGRKFPAYLDECGEGEGASLASFEWAWLECFHAAEAAALALSDLAGRPESDLLATRVGRHPAARLTGPVLEGALGGELDDAERAPALLISRPDANVFVNPASTAIATLFEKLNSPQPICNLLAPGSEEAGEGGIDPLLAMIEAGSLVLAGQEGIWSRNTTAS